ncbi:deoxyguanosinetriphosphate triphosphohydrolase [Alcaligenes ammonioxydans]|jgi:dGTPase|uniref:Deoxyguanosinetriphosphate triphosphohydrolase-like protein n=1 Tax=Alcaligenes ammonioxydans TaxID=2582914 RepID=A0ABX8SWQ8_9BURK|nr:deoxyguanosinetriphosphate triphosphohydrolase [Alcaligenes ammonioxydans]QBH19416.1 deoxyguanosinetriphosphate triphosphohydrolase [Alcaligenes faecalis]MCH1879815.1 deoxyguanosinetriphosphate triphosphohydrolase [Alcaligenes ammonioxydans]QXX80475.1 deoxyguanosinetriphosphate triphosphohydrolase [Alcaligenes ammonioxydans]WGQ35455.1 deoxyguanosinetriphosphate triphosphohydrolase [Alcaligenes faecalis]HRK85115.1 deoxyguanosinetriphosphate triphosphohydrolase [Alcaligenes faecalis]
MQMLAAYACHPEQSRGRRYAEAAPQGRNAFQRDRDRIIHCNAFRLLEYKTQVFINHEGDLFRTRLTHSLEVAQLARAIARNLGLHEDLIEAISLAHDLGHTPFGHAGQDTLNSCMQSLRPEAGGFEHNLQSLRVVDELEERYAAFNGLNLCFETREGILKHCSLKHARELGEVGQRFIDRTQPSLEAQMANLADEIAYNNHDIDDGLRSGLIRLEQLLELRLFRDHYEHVQTQYPGLSGQRLVAEIIRGMINTLVVDLTETTRARLEEHRPDSVEAIRQLPRLAGFSPELRAQADELKRFLHANLYRHYKVVRMMSKAQNIVRELFHAFLDDPRLLAAEHRREDPIAQARAIADYIAGMTDRHAIREHDAIFKM